MAGRPSSSSRTSRSGGDALGQSAIGQFVIDQEIGKGSFAQVYSGRHKVTGALVAIKSVELARLNKKLKENLYGEIKILKTLRHPHIVALHDCVESATHINLIMEYCELGDLSLFIKKREKLITNPATYDIARKYPNVPNSGLNEVVIRHFLKQLASALKFLREGNFVHRDVKPQNLLLLPSPRFREANKTSKQILSASHDSLLPVAGLPSMPMLKLADFGFARVLPSTSLAETLCGSPLYMAPEILRYERYDAKADLWSVGTVLHEMVTGRPPFRANNHVELLRKIEAADDQIRFPRETVVSSEMKSLIRALLKRNPVERLSFENFFAHPVVTGPIPGLVEDDVPKEERRVSRDAVAALRSEEAASSSSSSSLPGRRPSVRKQATAEQHNVVGRAEGGGGGGSPGSPRPRLSSPLATPIEVKPNPLEQAGAAMAGGRSPGYEGLGLRPRPQSSTSAPTRPVYAPERKHRPSTASLKQPARDGGPLSPSPEAEEAGLGRQRQQHQQQQQQQQQPGADAGSLQAQAAQDVAFERDYVLVEKRHVEVNAFADELAANKHLAEFRQGGAAGAVGITSAGAAAAAAAAQQQQPPKKSGGQIVRRATQQGSPTSTTGAVPAPPSRQTQVAQGKMDHIRQGSYDKSTVSGSPGSATSYISKAIQDASLRLFGVKYAPHVFAKGTSPPQLYSPFPAYPTPAMPAGLLGDGKLQQQQQQAGGGGGQPLDEDARVAQCIEDYATRSDVVYGFAEVKYKQLMPMAPSMDHGLGGVPADGMMSADEEDGSAGGAGGLTVEAVVALSEEALVLYVKALSLLAKSMDVASLWWARKSSGSGSGSGSGSSGPSLGLRINAAVQWIRARFNEILEKADLVRLKLVEAQKQLPEDHPSHPKNRASDSEAAGSSAGGGGGGSSSSAQGVFLSTGVSAEKLMYERALEMSRAAAINEIANEDLSGCEITYVTAIRMLEAVLDGDEEVPRRRESATSGRDEEASGEMSSDDQLAVQRVIQMVSKRLSTVRKKLHIIATASKAQQQTGARQRSGDVTPRSIASHTS